MTETWKTIPSFAGMYEASSLGRIRRIGTGRGVKPGRIIAQQTMNAGYLVVNLYAGNKAYGRLVHRLVAEAFHGECLSGLEVNHKNSDKHDNRACNLEYLTRSQNLLHAVEHTQAYRGERNGQAKITEDTARAILAKRAEGLGYKRLAKHFGLSWSLVRAVASGKTWKHLQ